MGGRDNVCGATDQDDDVSVTIHTVLLVVQQAEFDAFGAQTRAHRHQRFVRVLCHHVARPWLLLLSPASSKPNESVRGMQQTSNDPLVLPS